MPLFVHFKDLHFRTFKEKIVPGFPKSKRYLEDFMYFVKDDIHWFTLTIQQIILMAYALSQVNDKEGGQMRVSISLYLVILKRIIEIICIYKFMYTKDEINKKFLVV